ncbi:MAG: peptide-methionine (S)-S-oxide reductase MsrA [Pseudomonadota bacterium]
MFGLGRKTKMPEQDEALPGRPTAMPAPAAHFVNHNPLAGPFPKHLELAMFGMGCFWGAEKRFWQLEGVYSTAVGYASGFTPNPSYEEVCTGMTGHNEVVRLVFDPQQVSYLALLRSFWEGHNPTQGMRQGNDVGTQYRSGIYTFSDSQQQQAKQSRDVYQHTLQQVSSAPITTEIILAPQFYFAEEYHQQYLAKNPNGYCGLGGCGMGYPEV